MNVLNDLLQLGFNEKEASVYLAGLKTGQETAFNIAKYSKLKRSTVYFVLDKLKERGLVSTRQTRKTTYYSMISPNRLLKKIEKDKNTLQRILPEIQKIYDEQPNKPTIQTFEGKAGVMQVYNEVNEFLKKSKEVLYFGSVKHYEQDDYVDAISLWTETLKNKNYKAREIWSRNETKKKERSSYFLEVIEKNENPNHQIRFMPKGLHFIDNDNLIYGNKLAIFSFSAETFVILIESSNVANSYRSLFEVAWANTTKNKNTLS